MLAIPRANRALTRMLRVMPSTAALSLFLSAIVHAEAPRTEQVTPDAPTEFRMRERIRDMVGGMRDVPLPVIIEALSNHQVLPWNGESRDALAGIADVVSTLIETGGIEAARMNEAGNQVENVVIEAMRSRGFEARRPKGESGRVKSTGYPDLEVEIDGTVFYVEVKTFSAATIDSSQRSFYLSPSTDFKVTRDAIHLLVAVELSPGAKGSYQARSVRWLDLSGLRCDLKYEFNASNRDLYRRESGLVVIEATRDVAMHAAGAVGSPPANGAKN